MSQNRSVEQRSSQAAFDRVAQALRKQGVPALNRTGRCTYVNSEGHRCGVGHLLTAQELAHLKRGKRLSATLNELGREFVERLARRLGVAEGFLRGLQNAHDSSAAGDNWSKEWQARMRRLAKSYGLSATSLTR